ncbi:MAG: hypothetical protein ACK5N9_07520 [Pirellula sp.]
MVKTLQYDSNNNRKLILYNDYAFEAFRYGANNRELLRYRDRLGNVPKKTIDAQARLSLQGRMNRSMPFFVCHGLRYSVNSISR